MATKNKLISGNYTGVIEEPKVAALYIRVSTDDQTEYSPEAQERLLRDYAKKHNMLVEYVFVEEGISGKKAEKRPEFQRMIGLAKSKDHPIDVILVWKYSRFARNQEESIVYKSLLRRNNVDVISISEPILDGPFGSLIERIIEWMDEYYSINLAEEVKRGMTEKALRGGLQSTPPFGYRVENNILVPIPEEAALVQEIFERFANGIGLYPIARWLNDIGARTRRGNRFENRSIEYIIRNPVYIGKLRWTPTGKIRRKFNDENIIIADSEHEPIISKDLWDAAQKQMDLVKAKWGYKARPVYELKDWISGLVRCATCGTTLVFVNPRYYKCNNFGKGKCKTSQFIRADLLKDAIIRKLEDDCKTDIPIKYNIVYTRDNGANDINRLQNIMNTLQKKIERLREAYLAGAESVDEYKKNKDAIEAEIATVQERMNELISSADSKELPNQLKSQIKVALDTLKAPDASIEDKHNAAQNIIEKCIFDKSKMKLTIIYRFIF